MRLGAATARILLRLGARWRKRLTLMPSGRHRLSPLTAPSTSRSAQITAFKATRPSSFSSQDLPKEPSTKVHERSKHFPTGSMASSQNNSMLQLLRKKKHQPLLLLRREKSLFLLPPHLRTPSHRPNRLLSSNSSPLGVDTARKWRQGLPNTQGLQGRQRNRKVRWW